MTLEMTLNITITLEMTLNITITLEMTLNITVTLEMTLNITITLEMTLNITISHHLGDVTSIISKGEGACTDVDSLPRGGGSRGSGYYGKNISTLTLFNK